MNIKNIKHKRLFNDIYLELTNNDIIKEYTIPKKVIPSKLKIKKTEKSKVIL